MILRSATRTRRSLLTVATVTTLLFLLYFYHAPSHDFVHQHIPALQDGPSWAGHRESSATGPTSQLPLPDEYVLEDDGDDGNDATAFCRGWFTSRYLTGYLENSFQYCNGSSFSSLTCFHNRELGERARDSLCVVRGSVLDLDASKFVLNCEVQQPGGSDLARGIIPLEDVRQYWYDTGPRYVIKKFLDFIPLSRVAPFVPAITLGGNPQSRIFTLLVKREGALNPWHSLLEIWSMSMTLDILRMARDSSDPEGGPFFRVPEDIANLQVVILDDHLDGPYFDLWKLFSGREPLRLDQIRDNPQARQFYNATEQRIIIPLAGASNPIWKNDWIARSCTHSDMLRAFIRRVRQAYSVPTSNLGLDASGPIRVTFIDRKDAGSRNLENQDSVLEAVRAKYPHVKVDTVELAHLSFAEQLRVIQQTDVLVGVHGAGLTHTMFLREHTTAVVEIQLSDMGATYMGFRNLANMLGITYFQTHAEPYEATAGVASAGSAEEPAKATGSATRPAATSGRPSKRAAWHTENFIVDKESFVNTVSAAIQSVYNKGIRHYEAN